MNTIENNDKFNLSRFEEAQEDVYEQVVLELQSGQKRTHWMWFIFPQIHGLGQSSTSIFYAIKSEEEAKAYLNHPILGKRLVQCVNTILAINGLTSMTIFGSIDNQKLRSSMTLFASISDKNSLFHQVLVKYFNGNEDTQTLKLLK